MQLPDPASGPGKDAALVQRMFDRVAPRYDTANTVFSLGQDAHWRRVAVRAVRPGAGEVLLDVAAGTGALTRALAAEAGAGTRVVALDFSLAMLRAGTRTTTPQDGAPTLWVNGDGLRLPLRDGSVDAVTIAFGLRNLPRPEAGLAEFARVTRPGGRLAVLEFSRPTWPPFAAVYRRYLTRALPLLARWVTSEPAAYRYLADSIRLWPGQDELAGRIADAGWRDVRWKNLSGGIVALHHAVRS